MLKEEKKKQPRQPKNIKPTERMEKRRITTAKDSG